MTEPTIEPRFRVCVFCGASESVSDAYREVARALGRAIAERGMGLVYGGASVGLMRELADAALSQGGEVIGVIPELLVDKEIAHAGLSELVVVPSMHARKARMTELCHAFVALPGGYGTLDELFEVTTWAQLGLHGNPIGLLEVNDFFAPLREFVHHASARGFIKPEHRDLWLSSKDPYELLTQLEEEKGAERATAARSART